MKTRTKTRPGRLAVLRQLWPYMRKTRGSAAAVLLTGLLALPVAMVNPKFFQILIDDVMRGHQWELFATVAAGLLAVYAARLVLDAVSLFAGNRMLNRFTLSVRNDVWRRCSRLPYPAFERVPAGEWKMRLTDDVDKLGNFLREQVSEYLCTLITAGVALYLTWRIHPTLTLVCLPVVPLVFFVNYGISRGQRKVNEEVRQVEESYNTFTHGALQYWKEIKAQSAEETFIGRFGEYRRRLARLGMRSIRYWAYSEVFADFKANYLTRVLVYLAGVYFVLRSDITPGQLVMFAEYYAMLFTALDGVNTKNASLRSNMPYYRRVFDTLSLPEEETGERRPDLRGGILVDGVSFAYPSGGGPVLRSVDLRVPPGSVTAVVGRSGCGKTTLAKLLLGLYRPDSGRILLDGVPLEDIDRDVLREQIAVVMQDNILFNMSIGDNLRLAGQHATDAALKDACVRAGLDGFVAGLPRGLDTVIGEQGVRLSGGQKQRLAIAQALLRNPRILILDEATSSLDKPTEEGILRSLERLARSARLTVLIITHKPAAVRHADRVVVMENGQARDCDDPAEWLRRGEYGRPAENTG